MKELRQIRGERGPNGDVMVVAIYRTMDAGHHQVFAETLSHPEGPLDFANDSQGSIRLAQIVVAVLCDEKGILFSEPDVMSFAENFILPADHKRLIILQQEMVAWLAKEKANGILRSVQEGSPSPV